MMLHPGSQDAAYTPSLSTTARRNGKQTTKDSTLTNNNSTNITATPASIAAANRKKGDYLTALAIMRPCVLDYDVHSCSSYSASYLPENIKTNNPQDQSSRWSSGSNNQMQYIMIKLKSMAVAHTITFGKYHKVHVCNLKEFKVFGGLTTSNMTELLHTGLRNDHEPETFLLKHKTNSVVFPCQYIKIVPLMAWGANFNFSVWHVEVKGIPDTELVQETYFQYINFRETESVRLCLKHFRQRKLFDAFKALQERTHTRLEDPLLTKLHQELVLRGNFKRAEELIAEAAERGLFDQYIQAYDYKPIWKRLRSNSHRQGVHHHHHSHQSSHLEDSPRHRGGHQMCIDTKGGYVYLMGGWDGARDLADFWAYHIPSQTWILISADTSLQGGPSARSCHKICYSPQHQALFLLGKYVDPDNRSKVDLCSDFWRFDIDPSSPPHGRWTKICANTAVMNGPELIYDHQMCLDPAAQMLYVFGGRVVHLDKNVQHYSGLYSYHIPSGIWKLLRADGHAAPKQDGTTVLRSRIGHSMLYDETMRSLVIFAGQMNKDYLSDFYVYDIAADRVIEVCKDYNKQGGPEAGFTQRATISSRGREIYVLSGLVKDRALGAETVKNSFWVFKLPGQDQMDAIRDVQYALANAKTSGSIGSLESIMSHGRSLSGQAEQNIDRADGTSCSSSTRRKIEGDDGHGHRDFGRRSSGRISRSAHEPSSTADVAISGADMSSTGTIQTRSSSAAGSGSNNKRTNSTRSGSPPSFHPARANSDLMGSYSTSHGVAPNGREGAVPGISSATSIPSIHRRPSLTRTRLDDPTEPMSLAYVLSDQGSWQKIFQNSSPELGEPSEPEPAPRYAHQLVYDDVNEVQYLFGGNPGEQGNMSKRLDDFWELRLYRPTPDQIVRKAKYLLRTQLFKELCQRPETSVLTSTTPASLSKPSQPNGSSSSRRNSNRSTHSSTGLIQRGTPEHHDQSQRALSFLRNELSVVVDQTNKAESEEFKALIRGLLLGAFSPSAGLSSSLSKSQKPSFAFTGTRTNHVAGSMGNPLRTTVLLSPSPISSPSINSTRLMLSSPNPSSGGGQHNHSHSTTSGTRPFLASPDGNRRNMPAFGRDEPQQIDENGQDAGHEDEDSPMQGPHSPLESNRTPRPSRQRGGATNSSAAAGDGVVGGEDLDIKGLDHNGDQIQPRSSNNQQDNSSDDLSAGDRSDQDNSSDTGTAMDEDIDEDRSDDNGDDGGNDDEDDEYLDIDLDDQDPVMKGFYRDRTMLFERLLEFFAEDVKQPKGDLTDLVKVG
ncbi:Muskelin 1, intracellular mediator containing kelch motif [Mortierella hygrophila]|uniref:Muskelin 1, intracellular mediator containing kelch motif n=1 Tax=Mortierella hygrophila TaxID=979708 RepID=A0A9P6FDG5_9FUNG|nr:Muskelin 1, intracellular mediator containing kelch motif [Mortierella hygrophila]